MEKYNEIQSTKKESNLEQSKNEKPSTLPRERSRGRRYEEKRRMNMKSSTAGTGKKVSSA